MGSNSDQFNIRWNNYTTVLQSVFRKLLDGEQFVDVTLACEGKSIKCHRVVLSACSTYFEKILTDNSYPHLVIYIKDMKFWELQALVTFMYNGEVSVNQNKLANLVKAAESLKIKGLAPDSSLPENDQDKIDEDDIEEYHLEGVAKHENDIGGREESQLSLLRQQHHQISGNKQMKRKIMVAPPKLVKMQKIDRQANGAATGTAHAVAIAAAAKAQLQQQESSRPSSPPEDEDDDEDNFPHETSASSEILIKDEIDADDDMEDNVEVNMGTTEEGMNSGDGHSSASEVEESQASSSGATRTRFTYKYGKDIRDSALAALSSGMSLRQCSEAFGIPRKTLSKWKNRENYPIEDTGEVEEEASQVHREVVIRRPASGVQDASDRAERLQKAMELAISGVTVRQAAAHFDIPRTTLSSATLNMSMSVTMGHHVCGSSSGIIVGSTASRISPPITPISLIVTSPNKYVANREGGGGAIKIGSGTGDASSASDSENKGVSLPPGLHPKKIRVIRKHRAEILSEAALCILKGMTFQHVSEVFDVPKTTLRDYMVRRGLLQRGPPKKSGAGTPGTTAPTSSSSIKTESFPNDSYDAVGDHEHE